MANSAPRWLDLEYVPSEIRVWYCGNSWVITKYDNHGYSFDESEYAHYKSEALRVARNLAKLYNAKLVVENRTTTKGELK